MSHEAHRDCRPGPATAALAAHPDAGQKIFKAQCGICHAVEAGQNRIGPTLFGVVGRRSGSVPGFNSTADHKKLDLTWGAATLDKYLANPRAMVPDTSMIYAGLKDDAERADLSLPRLGFASASETSDAPTCVSRCVSGTGTPLVELQTRGEPRRPLGSTGPALAWSGRDV
jgi:cytochrome c